MIDLSSFKPMDMRVYSDLMNKLGEFEAENFDLIGILPQDRREVFCAQMVESLRRGRYVRAIATRHNAACRVDPSSDMFDPERGAVYFRDNHHIDDACWLVFLATHFGKNKIHGWRTVREFYCANDEGFLWDWDCVTTNFNNLEDWFRENQQTINYGFGNHRKYETLDLSKRNNTYEIICSYVNLILRYGGHAQLFNSVRQQSDDAEEMFDRMYCILDGVLRFGRLAKFDYLSLLGSLNLFEIISGSMYFNGASGPLKGAKLLFADDKLAAIPVQELERMCQLLNSYLQVGMQPLEDSLCNWQKSPSRFIQFRG